jgi:L-serine deaminase
MQLHNKADSRGDYLNKAKERLNTEEPEQYDDKKEKVDEWANNAGPGKTVSDTTFEQDIDFMTKVISGGLNKQKSTGQATVPVVASQLDRLTSHETTDINESVSDWKKLAGIK